MLSAIYTLVPNYEKKITNRNTWATATHILHSWVNVHGQAEKNWLFILILTLIPKGPRLTSQTHQLSHRRNHNFQQLLHFINAQCTKLDNTNKEFKLTLVLTLQSFRSGSFIIFTCFIICNSFFIEQIRMVKGSLLDKSPWSLDLITESSKREQTSF